MLSLLEIATVDSTVDCIEVRTQEKEFIRLTVEFDVTKHGYSSYITTDQICSKQPRKNCKINHFGRFLKGELFAKGN